MFTFLNLRINTFNSYSQDTETRSNNSKSQTLSTARRNLQPTQKIIWRIFTLCKTEREDKLSRNVPQNLYKL